MPDLDDPRVGVLSRALHTFHGRGYCTAGKHGNGQNFYCYDEARALLAALDGETEPGEYTVPKKALTLSARQQKTRARVHRV